jgi:hypothetical protein
MKTPAEGEAAGVVPPPPPSPPELHAARTNTRGSAHMNCISLLPVRENFMMMILDE